MQHKKQDKQNNCGQTCVAMISDMSIRYSEEHFFKNHDGRTSTKEVNKALNCVGFDSDTRLRRCPKNWDAKFPKLCIIKMSFTENKTRGGHWVIYYKGVVYDPGQDTPHPYFHYRKYIESFLTPTSFMEIYIGSRDV